MIKKYFSWLQKDNPTGLIEKYPELDEKKQTSLQGVYIAGDLTGVPLIKLAADGGARLIQDFEYDKDFDSKKGQNKGVYDVLIIGAGPAGLSAAIECQKRDLNYFLVESSQPFNTIENFPKGKPIIISPKELKSVSGIDVQDGNKESLLEEMKKQVSEYDLNIKNGVFVSELSRNKEGLIFAKTSKNEEFKALRVVLAIGKSGNARKLGAKGEDSPHVFDKLYDPSDFKGKNIMVVGGGDSAIETTIVLAQAGNKVYHSYRKSSFARPKEQNIKSFQELTKSGDVVPLFSSQVNEIAKGVVDIKTESGDEKLDVDVVFTMIGRELPVQFFKRSGIKIEGEKGFSFWTFLTCMLGFFSMIYFGKASGSMAVFHMDDPLSHKVLDYLKAPFTREGGTVKDIILFSLAWLGSLVFIISGIISLGIIIKNRAKYFGNTWNKIKYTYLVIVAIFLTWVYIRYNIGADQTGWSPKVTENFSLIYCITMLVFGIRRVMVRKTKYIKLQVITLLFIQTFFLYLLPFHFYDALLSTLGEQSWFMREVLPDRWACFALILFWPLYIVQFGQTTFWTWFPFIQSGLFLFLIIRYFGKGVFCGWICSCGGMAETMGDEYRHLAPHGPKAKKYENLGQIILFAAIILTILRFVLNVGSAHEVPILGGAYKILIDSLFAGVIGIGLYFFWGGRIWCRFGCPLAALMHLYTRFSKYRILSEKKKCISCNICTKVCHMGIDVMNYANKGIPMNDAECVRCSACIQSCPMDVLAFGSVAVDPDNKSREAVPSYGKDDWKAGIK